MKRLLTLFVLIFGIINANSQALSLKNTKWKSKSFWGYGYSYGITSEVFIENTNDPYNELEFLVEFDTKNFISTSLTLEESDVRQIKGTYHIFSNNFIKLEIDSLLCVKPNEPCPLSYKSDYVQIHKVLNITDNKIAFINLQYKGSWIDKIHNNYLLKTQSEKIKNAKESNYYIQWLPIETKKIKGHSYTIIQIVYEVQKTEKDFDIKTVAGNYKELGILYIQLPSRKIYEINKKGKLEEWIP